MTRECRRSDAGITLIELVAVLAIFSLVAVMGLQALTGAMRARDRLAEADDRNAAVSRMLTLLRSDLKAAVPRGFAPPGAAEPEPAFLDRTASEGTLAFSAGGQPVLPDAQAAGLARIVWRHNPLTGDLTRQVWPVLRPAGEGARAPEVVMLEGVESLTVLAHAGEEGWVGEYGHPDGPPRPPLPAAVDVVLGSAARGPMRVVVTY